MGFGAAMDYPVVNDTLGCLEDERDGAVDVVVDEGE